MTIATPTLQSKCELLMRTCNSELIERQQIIETMVLALLSGTHHFQLGPPGIAKSASINAFVLKIDGLDDGDFFQELLSKYSTPESLFGPLNIPALKLGRYCRNEALTLEVAKIAFVDEVFKGSISILNTLLEIINERTFKNDGKKKPVPLSSLFTASNEMPESTELNALFDRLHFRHVLDAVREQGHFIEMLKLGPPSDQKILSWDDIEQAKAEVVAVDIPDDVFQAFNKVREDLKQKQIFPSDRRFMECRKIVKAAAWLRGDTVCELEDMRPLAHVLWDQPKDAPTVESVLLGLASPTDLAAAELIKEVQKLDNELAELLADATISPREKHQGAVQLHSKATQASKECNKLRAQIEKDKPGRQSARVEQCREMVATLTEKLLEDVFDIDDVKAE